MANYMPANRRSAAVLDRLGFAIEGKAKAYLYLGGQWRDHVLTSLTNPASIVPQIPGEEGAPEMDGGAKSDVSFTQP